LFLLPSESESFGLAALEAMVNKVPVISSNAGGIPEVNMQGVTGYLSNIGNIDDMAKNAISILKDDEILATFKMNAVQEAQKFDIQKVVPLYEEIYQRAYDSRFENV
jgi:glycosyltransferase involved in cell wall biosynthesis